MQLLIEECHGLWADTLQAEDLEQRLGEFLQQLLADLASASGGYVANAGRQVLANARPRAQPGFVESRRRFGRMCDDVGAIAVRANLERVLALQLEQVGDIEQHARDGAVVERGRQRRGQS